MTSNLTNTLSRLSIAEKNKRKHITLSKLNSDINLLNFLWKKGFIYGYTIIESKVIVFLKYLLSGKGTFSKIIFLKKQEVSRQELKSLDTLNKNRRYLVLTTRGVFSIDVCVRLKLGGRLIAYF